MRIRTPAMPRLEKLVTRASLMLVGAFFLVSPVLDRRSSLLGQVTSTSVRQVGRHAKSERQSQHGIRHSFRDDPSLRKSHVSAELPQAATLAPIFLEYPYYPTGHDPTAAAVGDFNGDGKLDLAVANQTDNTVSVLLGSGDMTFQDHVDYATGNGPVALAVGDFNGDGRPDLAVANQSDETVSILLGNGDGSFQAHIDCTTGASSVSAMAVGDFDKDGKMDLTVVGNSIWIVLLGNGDGTFQLNTDVDIFYLLGSVAVGDLNGDGNPDLVMAAYAESSGGALVMLGNGDGSFQAPVQYPTGMFASFGAAVGDFNADGKLDLAVTNELVETISVVLGNGDGTFQAHEDYATGAGPSLVSVGDFNGDGKLDLAVDNEWDNSVSILLGNGDGTFKDHIDYAVGNSPSIAIGDFNNDGKPDIAATNTLNNSVSILTGESDGAFRADVSYSNGRNPYEEAASSLIVGDFNNDGKPDVAWTDTFTLGVLLGDGEGSFAGSETYPEDGGYPGTMATGDFNRDGNLDLAVLGNGGDNGVYVLLGNGDGTLQAAVIYPIAGRASWLVAGDFNGDSKSDLAVTNGNTVSVLLGNGDGTFQTHGDYATGNNPSSVAVGDFNHDGKSDLAVTNRDDNTLSVLLGNGDGTFHAAIAFATGGSPWSVAAGDFNRDGKSDLAVTNSNDNTLSVLLGNGDGTFRAQVDYPTGGTPQSLVVTDFNGDGKPDLAATNYADNSVSVLLGNGDGTFQPTVQYASGQARFAAIGDFNLDGSNDLAVLGPNSEVTILRNIRGTMAQLKSSVNPSALGQVVTLTTTVGLSLNNVGLAAPSGSIEFTDGTNDLGTQTLGADGVVTLVVNALTAGNHAISAIYSGDANFNPHTVTLSQVVDGPDFGMSVTPGAATLSSGSSQTFALTVTSMYGFNGALSLTCSVSPTPASAPTCGLNPASITLTSGSATSNLTVVTNGPTASLLHPGFRPDFRPLYALWLPISGVALLLSLAKDTKRKKMMLAVLLTTLLMAGLGLQMACSGGSNNMNGSGGTPAGTYIITLKGASASVTHTHTVTVTVQ